MQKRYSVIVLSFILASATGVIFFINSGTLDNFASKEHYPLSGVGLTEATATNIGLSDQTSAKSFVIHIKTVSTNYDVYTVSKISQIGSTTTFTGQKLQFESIPSKDKSKFYGLIAGFANTSSGSETPTFDMSIDILAGDGSTIETLQYAKCNIISYYVSTNDNKQQYRIMSADASELREYVTTSCGGIHMALPSK